MISIQKPILKALYSLLSTQSVPVYSLVPDDVSQPFIYIGDIVSEPYDTKCNFHRNGTVNVEVFYKLTEADGSLDAMLDTMQHVKNILQPTPDFVPDVTNDGLAISQWDLDYEEMPMPFTDDRRLLTAVLQYGFLIGQTAMSADSISNVIHLTDRVMMGTNRVIHIV